MNSDFDTALQGYYNRQRETLAKEPEIRGTLLKLGVFTVQAEYDGVGDSGQIDQVRYLDGAEPASAIEVDEPIHEQVESLLYALLNLRHGGWENNDGAFGSFSWNLVAGSIEHIHNQRYTDHETSVYAGFESENQP